MRANYDMNIAGLGVFALGVVLLFVGFSEAHSLSSDISRFFTGHPTERSVWLILGGALALTCGFVLSIRGSHGT